ncbi:hypothetical protein DFP94_1011410 [Fontibacillus phaseoli]|uniref:Uncharacterized protein n=1 Tax=Fontibacillus phaseoli TaxID=1416533 RepID=A0A369BTA1_9BACL|nr:hypothetical protein [Fontibacillus phaseoli]RCX23806.1 hypothetical protein DFP94_1011410 [Fontibacillus phaseoli]
MKRSLFCFFPAEARRFFVGIPVSDNLAADIDDAVIALHMVDINVLAGCKNFRRIFVLTGKIGCSIINKDTLLSRFFMFPLEGDAYGKSQQQFNERD